MKEKRDKREEGREGEEEKKEEKEKKEPSLEAVVKQLERANDIFHRAVTDRSRERRKELLEEALREYASVLPLLNPYRKDPWCRLAIRSVLDKIHAVEHWIELEIAESVMDSNNNSRSNHESVDQALTEARLLLMQHKQID